MRPARRAALCLTGLGLLTLDVRHHGRLARADERILLSVARLPHPPALVRAALIVTGLGDARVARLLGPVLAGAPRGSQLPVQAHDVRGAGPGRWHEGLSAAGAAGCRGALRGGRTQP